MARMLIVGGGCRGRRLAGEMLADGHAVRITTRTENGRAAIEATGAECWVGTPDRLATLRGSLDSVTIAGWFLAGATGTREQVQALHGSRLEFFLGQAIDTTVRGLVYDRSSASVSPLALASGEQIVRTLGERNAIPVTVLAAAANDHGAWLSQARAAVESLLGAGGSPSR